MSSRRKFFATCILGKIRPANPPLAYPWIVPGGGYYAQWLWDTMFVVDLYSLLPNTNEIIRGVFQNYWDFQQRWPAARKWLQAVLALDIKSCSRFRPAQTLPCR